jgi:pimeloyl-ACP methyl ester carboxylesterase
MRLNYYGFAFRRTVLRHFLMIFPMRPVTLFYASRSPAKRLTYWHRPHTSQTRRPVIFIHGIGIGLYPYVNFLAELDSRLNSGRSSNDRVGIIAIEIMPVSFRITHCALTKDEMCEEIGAILKYHGLSKPVLVSHSYGTVIATQLLKSPKLADNMGPIVLIDPVSFLLHLPDVAYNFTRRTPKRANEHQLYYFASMDMGVSHSLSRCFFWSENVLWKRDIGDRPITVSLAERDLIVDTAAVGAYLATHNDELASGKKRSVNVVNGNVCEKVISGYGTEYKNPHQRPNGHANGHDQKKGWTVSRNSPNVDDCAEWKDRNWVGEGLDLTWFRKLDHAQVFDSAHTRKPLIDAISEYSARPY